MKHSTAADNVDAVEQLEEGGNGFRLESHDFWQMVGTLERVLNRRKTSNHALAEMSKRSVEIARSHQGDWRDTLIALLSASLGPAVRLETHPGPESTDELRARRGMAPQRLGPVDQRPA